MKKKKLIIGGSVVLGLVIVGVATFSIIKSTKEPFLIKGSSDIEYKEDIKVSDLVKVLKGVRVLSNDIKIDTNNLGEQEITIKYVRNNKEGVYKLKVNIVDKDAPEIKCEDVLEVSLNEEINLDSYVTATDNYDKDIKVTIGGDFDISTPGEYNAIITAVDSSGNKTEKKVTLKVREASIKTTGYYVLKEKEFWAAYSFNKDGKISYLVNPCPGLACGGYGEDGTYKVNGSTIKASFDIVHEDIGSYKRKKPVEEEMKIVDNNTIIVNNYKFTHKKSFN